MTTTISRKNPRASKTRFVDTTVWHKSSWDILKDDVCAAFASGGIEGIRRNARIERYEAMRLARRFGLVKDVPTKAELRRKTRQNENNLKHLREVWGWNPGDTELVLTRSYTYEVKRAFMAGSMCFKPGEHYRCYTLPTGAVRRYLVDHGVKQLQAGEYILEFTGLRDKGSSLTIKIEG